MRYRIVGVLAIAVIMAGLSGLSYGGDGLVITLDGDVVRYIGSVTDHNCRQFLECVAGKHVRKIIITSGGGDISSGMDMGYWIFEHGVDVEVERMCMSSCANYIFTAGRNKIIKEGAVVAWHGNIRQASGLSEEEILADMKKTIAILPEEQRKKIDLQKGLEGTLAYMSENKKKEADFFKTIGVDEYVCRVGNEKYGAVDFYILSVEDMERFGIKNVQASPRYHETDLTEFLKKKPIKYIKLREDR